MTNQQADMKDESLIGWLRASPRKLVDRAGFPATPSCCGRETTTMNVVDSRKEITLAGAFARIIPSCRVICSVDRLLSLLLAVLAGLVLVGLLGTQALAHDGHDAATGASAPGIEAVVSVDEVASSGDIETVTANATLCGGHCCFSSLCCPAVALALDASAMRPRPATAAATSAVDLIAAGPPEGPRRPPKPRL
jgi:hypothetical protein